jgi:photosystem II stability/assembly factor-like uncharacterized protein
MKAFFAALMVLLLAISPIVGGSHGAQAAAAGALSLSEIHMVSPTNGWALADCRVFHTTQGPSHWTNITPSRLPCSAATSGRVAGRFLDSHTAWAAVVPNPNSLRPYATVYRTTNAGQSWQSTRLPSHGQMEGVQSVSFIDARHGWVMVIRGVGAGQMQYDLYRTSDGGAHWDRVMSAGVPHPTPNSLPGCDCIDGFNFATPSIGFATGEFFAGPNAVFLYYSRDGGQTWQRSPLSVPPHYDFLGVRTAAPHFSNAATGTLPVFLSGQVVSLYSTRNGGGAWTRTASVRISPGTGAFYAFLQPSEVFLTDGAHLYHTMNAGRSWISIRPNVRLLGQIQFLTHSLGFELDRSGSVSKLYRTSDGGHTWSRVTTAAG